MTRFTLFTLFCLFTACGQGVDAPDTAEAEAEATEQELIAARAGRGLLGSTFLCSLRLGICQSEGGSAQQCEAQYRACVDSLPPSQTLQ